MRKVCGVLPARMRENERTVARAAERLGSRPFGAEILRHVSEGFATI
jgi:hypothetical protein